MYDFFHNSFLLCRIDWTAVFTAALAIIALWQLRKLNKTSSAEFMHKLKSDLSNEKTSLLFAILDNDCLNFININEIPYFEIELDKIKDERIKNELGRKIKKFREGSFIVDSVELDESLLGHIEDLGILYKRKIIDIGMIYDEFYWNIEMCWDNQNIKNYITHLRETEGWDIYYEFENIYNKCKAYSVKKERKR